MIKKIEMCTHVSNWDSVRFKKGQWFYAKLEGFESLYKTKRDHGRYIETTYIPFRGCGMCVPKCGVIKTVYLHEITLYLRYDGDKISATYRPIATDDTDIIQGTAHLDNGVLGLLTNEGIFHKVPMDAFNENTCLDTAKHLYADMLIASTKIVKPYSFAQVRKIS